MGMNVVPLKELVPDEPKVLTLELLKNMDPNDVQNEKSRGQIVVELLYKPFKEEDMPAFEDAGAVQKASEGTPPGGGELVVRVHEAQDVEGKHHTNPYVRILFKGEERKTKVGYEGGGMYTVLSPPEGREAASQRPPAKENQVNIRSSARVRVKWRKSEQKQEDKGRKKERRDSQKELIRKCQKDENEADTKRYKNGDLFIYFILGICSI